MVHSRCCFKLYYKVTIGYNPRSEAPGEDGRPNNGSDPWRTSGYQNISFAESYDLIHWTRPAPLDATYFSADPRYYNEHLDCGSRWDCIYTIPVPLAMAGTAIYIYRRPVLYFVWRHADGR